MRPALVRSTRRRRLVVGGAVGAFLLGSATLAGCNTPVITGLANPPAGSASSDPAAAPTRPTTIDPPSAVPPAASPAPAAVLPPPELATTCADHDYRNADGNCVHQPTPVVALPAASPPVSLSGASRRSVDLPALAARVDPGLVHINTRLGQQNGGVAGTGIVLSASGEVITNNHVISGGTSIEVTDVGNGQTYSATVVGYDRGHDIAVLALRNASDLQTAAIGDSSSVAVGDATAAIGNAGGRGGTPSIVAGTVLALDQTIMVTDDITGSAEQLAGVIRVAAELQPGDSGGPLVNTAGQVVGIDTAAATAPRSSGAEGFAIPINDAIAIGKQIDAGIASPSIHIGPTGALGIVVQTPTRARDGSAVSGALVTGVTPGSPGGQSGLAAGDVIVSLDGAVVDSPTTMITLLVGHYPGDLVPLTWVDPSGQQHVATVVLEVGPPT
ncbi:MAG: S1C family serine protease [Actinomycetota bacterium]|nr:S1C family serine protease [Actinomycetota bacterium]